MPVFRLAHSTSLQSVVNVAESHSEGWLMSRAGCVRVCVKIV